MLSKSNEDLNDPPSMQDKQHRSALQIFVNTNVAVSSKDWYPFGCLVYDPNSRL